MWVYLEKQMTTHSMQKKTENLLTTTIRMDKYELSSSVSQAQLIQDGVIDVNHRCPNADLQACEFCKLLNIFAIAARTYILK